MKKTKQDMKTLAFLRRVADALPSNAWLSAGNGEVTMYRIETGGFKVKSPNLFIGRVRMAING